MWPGKENATLLRGQRSPMTLKTDCDSSAFFMGNLPLVGTCFCLSSPPKMHSSRTIPKKRLACDRCHSRKLRCSGDLQGCSRCLRDESVCTYSPALKVGRPSKASMATRETRHETSRQSRSDAAFPGLSDGGEASSSDPGISMPPSPPHLSDSCITGSSSVARIDICVTDVIRRSHDLAWLFPLYKQPREP